jgi:hypothetical protein
VLVIACWNAEIVQVGFALDSRDREAIGHVAADRDLLGSDIRRLMQQAVVTRFGSGAVVALFAFVVRASIPFAQIV